jgi:hypothetical protein
MVLLEDSERVPDVFLGFGAIPQSELSDWLNHHSLVLPSDLVESWQLTGGGDVFESETILRPSVPTPPSESFIEDDIESANLAHDANGWWSSQNSVCRKRASAEVPSPFGLSAVETSRKR